MPCAIFFRHGNLDRNSCAPSRIRIPARTLRPSGVYSGSPPSPEVLRAIGVSDGARRSRDDIEAANQDALFSFTVRMRLIKSGAIIYSWGRKDKSRATASPLDTDPISGATQSGNCRAEIDAIATRAEYCANDSPDLNSIRRRITVSV